MNPTYMNDEVLEAQMKMKKVYVEQLHIPFKEIKIVKEEKMINANTGEVITYRKEL